MAGWIYGSRRGRRGVILGFPPKKGWSLGKWRPLSISEARGYQRGGPGGSWAGKSGAHEEIWTWGPRVQMECICSAHSRSSCFHIKHPSIPGFGDLTLNFNPKREQETQARLTSQRLVQRGACNLSGTHQSPLQDASKNHPERSALHS